MLAFIIVFSSILFYGVKIDKFETDQVKLEELYIKLNKKLIFEAKNIFIKNDLPKIHAPQNSKQSVQTAINAFSWINRLFERIHIINVAFDENNATLVFSNDIYYAESPFLDFVARVEQNGDEFEMNIDELWLKDYDLTLFGKLKSNFKAKTHKFDGNFIGYGISGNLDFNASKNILDYHFSDILANNLRPLIYAISTDTDMSEDLREWLTQKISASEYKIPSLVGKLNLKTAEYYPRDIESVGYARDLNVSFHHTLPPARANFAQLTLRNGNLYFDFDKIFYQNADLNSSHVIIERVLEKGTNIFVNLRTKSLLDEKIGKILKAYDINLPLSQKSGKTDANLTLEIKAVPYDLKTYGNFVLRDSDIEISGAKFHTNHAKIDLNGTKVEINANLAMKGLFDSQISGLIDIHKMRGEFKTNFSSLTIKNIYKNTLNTTATLDFNSKDTILKFAKPNVKLSFAKNTNRIEIPDIMELKQGSKLMKDLGVLGGELSLETADFDDMSVDIKNAKLDFDLLRDKNGKIYNSDDVSMHIKNGSVKGATKSDHLGFEVAKNGDVSINLKNIDFLLNLSDNNGGDLPKLAFNAQKTRVVLLDFNRTLDFDNFYGTTNGKNVNFNGKMGHGDVSLVKTAKLINLDASGISGEYANAIIGQESFNEGIFKLKIYGTQASKLNGEIFIQNAYLKDFTFYHGLLSFLDSVPSLLTFKTPDFNQKGFTIKNGKIYFAKNDNIISLKGVNFIGTSADIAGLGTINLRDNSLNIDLEIKYLKDASKIIGSIPVVSQIFLGRDKKLSVIIKVDGTLEKPKFKSQFANDLLSTPFTLIKNVLELPLSIFD